MRLLRIAPSLVALLTACAPASPDRAPPSASATSAPPTVASSSIGSGSEPPLPIVAPSGAPSSSASPPQVVARLDLQGIDALVQGAIDRGEVPGAVVLVIRGGAVAFRRAYGARILTPEPVPMREDAVFDLASITKAVCVGPAIALLREQGKLAFGDRVARHLPGFASRGKGEITLEQLLLHTSGLPADNALVDYEHGREQAFARLVALPLEAPPGTRFSYSDVGYLVLGAVVEKVSGEPLDRFMRTRFFAPLGMHDTAFTPGPALAARAVPTEPRDGALLQGVVHDPRASRLGGVAGHAGLFSTADDLGRFARMLLAEGELDGARVLAPGSVRDMTRARALPDEGARALGWDVSTRFSGNRGDLPGGYGHTGFTGPSIWIEPKSRTAVIILTSRLHPDGKGDARRLRREVASFVAHHGATLDSAPASTSAPRVEGPVLTGIDVLEREGFARVQGRHLGLVTHAAAVNRRGTRTIDVLRHAPGVHLIALFSPEHGLRSEQDRAVDDGQDEASGLPVHSLYGARTRPSEAALQGIDTLVYDLQDAGARFYTYEATLGFLLETAAQKKIPLLVLDRPNPLGGTRIEGPMLDPGRTSFTAYHPLPIRHGLTVGELARLFNGERSLGASLDVVPMEGLHRGDTWDRTGLLWRPPSPNLKTFTEALLYPGIALFETTNLSVGRGTDRPFEHLGAPWLDGARLALALGEMRVPGVTFTATSFTPTSSTFAGTRCAGIEIHVDDRARFEPVRTGLAIAVALHRIHPGEWQSKGMLTLLGSEATLAAIERGDSVEQVMAGYREGVTAFAALRGKYLIYR